MKIKSFLARPYAAIVSNRIKKGMATAVADQKAILQQLLKAGAKTSFGKDHKLGDAKTYEEYRQAVPIRDYEAFKPYIEQIKAGQQNVLWKGKPMYFAKTSGTTSGVKYIPITKDSISNHIDTAKNALLCYMAESGKPQFADGRMIFLSGSPELERVGGADDWSFLNLFALRHPDRVPFVISTSIPPPHGYARPNLVACSAAHAA